MSLPSISPLKPFGVRVSDIDSTNQSHAEFLHELLKEHPVIHISPKATTSNDSTAPTDLNLDGLASIFSENSRPSSLSNATGPATEANPVQMQSAQDSSFRIVESWRVAPPVINVVAILEESGAEIRFRDMNHMYEGLDAKLQSVVHEMSWVHPTGVEAGDGSQHPGAIQHPESGKPMLFLDQDTQKDHKGLLDQILKAADDGAPVLKLEAMQGDIVLWDNLQAQHAINSGSRVEWIVGEKRGLRLDRWAGELTPEDLVNRGITESDCDKRAAYTKNAPRYEQEIEGWGYRLQKLVASMLIKHWDGDKTKGPHILDVAAGTGKCALELLKIGWKDIEGADLTEAMLEEAKRRDLYRKYFVSDANVKTEFADDEYDAVTCSGGLIPSLIKPRPAIEEMVRVVRKGGLVVYSTRKSASEYSAEVNRLAEEKKVEILEIQEMNGLITWTDIIHQFVALRVL